MPQAPIDRTCCRLARCQQRTVFRIKSDTLAPVSVVFFEIPLNALIHQLEQ